MEKSFAQRNLFWEDIRQNKRNLFSLCHAGKKILSTELSCHVKNTQKDKNKEITELEWQLPENGLTLTLKFTLFNDFPYLEYESFIKNSGSHTSGIIEELKMLDLNGTLAQPYYGTMKIKEWDSSAAGNRLKISYYLGSFSSGSDFIRVDRRLYPKTGEETLQLNSEDFSRPSERAMPFFRVDFDDLNGYDIGVGWSGSWVADFSLKSETSPQEVWKRGKNWNIISGMPHTHFCVKPGETLREPGYFIGFRNDITVRDFINIHRRFMMTHHAPHDSKGNLLLPPLSAASWGGVETENMKKVLRTIKEKELPFEVHWIDAGWQGHDGPCPHPCDESASAGSDWPQRVGSNRINRYAHPNGLSEITDFARECGLKTMVWFEPERYHKECGSALFQAHPDWFLDNPSHSYIFDLGNPEACEWLTNWTLDFLEREKIEFYRIDQNINFRETWQLADEPDRIGVHEMKHIDNLYRFWGALRAARPDMFIDNCASGGRRLDYMLATYSFPLCQSDFETFQVYNYTCVHLENYYLNEVYPLHSTLSWMPEDDSYAMLSGGCGLGIGSKRWQYPSRYPAEDFDYDIFRKHLFAFREMREFLTKGNYYQLSKNPEDLSEFCAMQAHDPAKQAGFVLIFRRPETPEDEFLTLLPEIDPQSEYELRDFAAGTVKRVSGKDLRYFRKTMPEKRSASLMFYQKI